MSKGIVIFAHNNRQIDYGKIALANACTIKDSMSNNNITLITDDGTANWLYKEGCGSWRPVAYIYSVTIEQ